MKAVFTKIVSAKPYLFQAYLILLVLLSILPINNREAAINHVFIIHIRLDYLLHCLVYIPLALLLKLSFGNIKWLTFLTGMILLILFAVFTEGVQYMLPYRSFNINDLLANCLGVLLGLIPLLAYNIWLKKKDVKPLAVKQNYSDNRLSL